MEQEQIPQIKLPFGECARRSFLYIFTNFNAFTKLASVWFLILIYEVAVDFPSLCGLEGEICPSKGYQNLSVVIMYLASISIAVGFSRQIILKEERKYFSFSFGWREIKYLGYNLLLFLLVAIPAGIIVGMLKSFGVKGGMLLLSTGVVSLFFAINFARCFIILPAIAVDDKDLTMEKAFKLTKGNANKIFWGQVLLRVPLVIAVLILTTMYEMMEFEGLVSKFIMSALLIGLSYFDAALKASFYSHVYQYFTYFLHHQEQLSKD